MSANDINIAKVQLHLNLKYAELLSLKALQSSTAELA